MKIVKCINPEGFVFLSINKEYEVVEESRDYYYIRNNNNVIKRYGKSRFEEVGLPTQKDPVVPKIPKVKKEKGVKVHNVICKIATLNLTFDKKYEVISETERHYCIMSDNNKQESFLKARFEDA